MHYILPVLCALGILLQSGQPSQARPQSSCAVEAMELVWVMMPNAREWRRQPNPAPQVERYEFVGDREDEFGLWFGLTAIEVTCGKDKKNIRIFFAPAWNDFVASQAMSIASNLFNIHDPLSDYKAKRCMDQFEDLDRPGSHKMKTWLIPWLPLDGGFTLSCSRENDRYGEGWIRVER